MRDEICTKFLNTPGITPVIIRGEEMLMVEPVNAVPEEFQKNVYVKCLREIISHWQGSFYFIDALIREGIVKQLADYSLEWMLNKTSLAWLFKKMYRRNEWLEENNIYVPISGGFWYPVETLFKIKRGSLKNLLHIKETYYSKPSPHIKKLKSALHKYGFYIPMPK